jgi:ABC-2 type transport system ATP-binding protein
LLFIALCANLSEFSKIKRIDYFCFRLNSMSIEIKNITKIYGNQKALDSVSFVVNKGELTGFLGPNGAGKSTLMKIITGFLPPTEGEVFIDSIKVEGKNVGIRQRIGYLPENNPLYPELYIKEFLEITAGFYHLEDRKKKVSEIVEITGLGSEQHKKIGVLSKGFRQRVGLAQALIHDPSVLILDEPTSGLDPNQLEEIRNLIRQISQEKTVMLSTHIMQEVEAVCNRVLIINKGKIVADGKAEDLKNNSFGGQQQVVVEFAGEVRLNDLQKIAGVQNAVFNAGKWEIMADRGKDIRAGIFDFAVKNNLTLIAMQETRQSLENVFQELTK